MLPDRRVISSKPTTSIRASMSRRSCRPASIAAWLGSYQLQPIETRPSAVRRPGLHSRTGAPVWEQITTRSTSVFYPAHL